MTRAEAIAIVKLYGTDIPADAPNSFVGMLEKLGVLKLDAEIQMPNGIQKILSNKQIEELALLMKKDAWEFINKNFSK